MLTSRLGRDVNCGVHFESEVQMLKFEELHTHVAIADDPEQDDEDEEEQQNSGSVASGIVSFEIWGDGDLLWSSPEIRVADRKKINWKDEKYACAVPILHVEFLELRTRCKGSNTHARVCMGRTCFDRRDHVESISQRDVFENTTVDFYQRESFLERGRCDVFFGISSSETVRTTC